MADTSPAVLVRGASKQYGRGKNAHKILDNFNMTVYGGTIYGLLGASGCGKTTLLSCIVGAKNFNSGDVWVLGGKPGTKNSGVPGPRIGYMPQDVALIGEFTVKGSVTYFGWICGLTNEEIDSRYAFLSKLLELPPEDRYIKNLSGGQQRRVSFAAALVHSPELLILDEPTVGLDPILRASIWQHLVELTVNQHLTVIITTHYIEEAAQAHRIGLLRGGKLLAEQRPNDLMSMFNCTNLEDVFLLLSNKQDSGQLEQLNTVPLQADSIADCAMNSSNGNHYGKLSSISKYNASCRSRMKALLYKNFARILLNFGGMFFLILFPIVELVVFFLAIGGDPKGLKFAVVNEELLNTSNCNEYSRYYPTEPIMHSEFKCDFRGLSCNYLNRINESKEYFKDMKSATAYAQKGLASGVLYFPRNFSIELQRRREDGRYSSNDTIGNSEINVHLDMSDWQISLYTQTALLEAYLDFARDTFTACNLSSKLAKVPMKFNDPVYGEGEQNFAHFMTPGLLITMIFFLATTLTATVIITERNEGVWDRSIVEGVTPWEILISHIFSQMICMLVQLVLVLTISFYIFSVPYLGNLYTMISLIGLQGFCGMCFGFVVSSLCDNLTTANYLALGSFYPTIFLSGLLWPLEGMPAFLRWIAKCLPGTIAILSLHDILERGRSILDSQVYIGFIITVVWIVMQIVICFLVLKIKNK